MNENEIMHQRVIPYLQQLGYRVIRLEQRFGLGSRRVVADAVTYDERDRPVVLVAVKPTLRKMPAHMGPYDILVQQVLQAALTIGVQYFLLTDGERHFWFEIDRSLGLPRSLEKAPMVTAVLSTQVSFHAAAELSQLLKSLVLYLQTESDLPAASYTGEVLKLLQAKVADETRTATGAPSLFYSGQEEDPRQVFDRLQDLYREWQPPGSQDRLSERIPPIAWDRAASLLEPFPLMQTDSPVLREAFLDVVHQLLGAEYTGYWWSSQLANFIVEIVAPQPGERVLDPACGTGSFLASTLAHWVTAGATPDVGKNVFGIDINPTMIQMARLNVAINRGHPAQIIQADSLALAPMARQHPPGQASFDSLTSTSQWDDEPADPAQVHVRALESAGISQESFDVVLTNPPWGPTHVIPESWKRYEIVVQRRFQGFVGAVVWESLFLERSLQFLKPGGRLGILLPASFLTTESAQHAREWLLERANLEVIISFQSIVATCLMVVIKEPAPRSEHVFMAEVKDQEVSKPGNEASADGLAAILEEYRRYRAGDQVSNPRVAWLVPQTEDFRQRLDPRPYRAEYRRIRQQLSASDAPVVRLEEVAEVIVPRLPTPRLQFRETGVPIIGGAQIFSGRVDLLKARRVDTETLSLLPDKLRLRAGDILMLALGHVGRSILISENDLPAIAGQGVLLIRVSTEQTSAEYVHTMLSTATTLTQIEALRQGSSVPIISVAVVKELLIPLFDADGQTRVIERSHRAAELRRQAQALEEQALAEVEALVQDGNDAE